MTPCTLWYRFIKDADHPEGYFEFNHLDDRHVETLVPPQKHPAHRWNGGRWQREHAWLSTDLPPKVIHDQVPTSCS